MADEDMKLKWGESEVAFERMGGAEQHWKAKVCNVTLTLWCDTRWYCDCEFDFDTEAAGCSGYTAQDTLGRMRDWLEGNAKQMQAEVDNIRATVDFGKAKEAPASVLTPAVEPIRPPYVTLLSYAELWNAFGPSALASDRDLRRIGAATLEAMSKELYKHGWFEASRMCNTRVKEELNY